jgi:hypothetical protein
MVNGLLIKCKWDVNEGALIYGPAGTKKIRQR